MHVGNGSVIIELTGTPSVALDLETESGSISNSQDVSIIEESKYTLIGTIGSGASTLTVDVGNGNITIK